MTTFSLTERAQALGAAIDVDQDSCLLSVELDQPAAPEQGGPELLGEALGASLGVRHCNRILTIGDLVLVFSAEDRLRSLEWRFGPAVLRSGPVSVPNGPAIALRIDAAWDENGRADVSGRTLGIFDHLSFTLAIQLGPEPSVWGFVAQGLAVGLSQSGALVGVVLQDCPLDLCTLVGAP